MIDTGSRIYGSFALIAWTAGWLASPAIAAPETAGAVATVESDADDAASSGNPASAISIHGRVLGPQGQPIAGARLFMNVDEWTVPIELGVSDANGRYSFRLAEEKLRRVNSPGFHLRERQASLLALAEGFGPGWAELPSLNGGRMGQMQHQYARDFRLAEDMPIEGRVMGLDGRPVAGAEVSVDALIELTDPNWYKMAPAIDAQDADQMTREEIDANNWFTPLYHTAWQMIPPAVADADGRFRLAGVGANRAVRLNFNGPGVRMATVTVLTRADATDFAAAVRDKYPRTPRPDGYFYPQRESAPDGDQGVLLFGPEPMIEVDPARTVAGLVRDAATGEPIAGLRMQVAGTYSEATTDRRGRYRLMRGGDGDSLMVYTYLDKHDRYVPVVRKLDDAAALGEITADFNVPRGTVVEGIVTESGTHQPIISAPSSGCHITWPGPLQTGHAYYYPLASNESLRGTELGLYFEGFAHNDINYYSSAKIRPDGRFRLAVPPGPGVILVKSSPGTPFGTGFGGLYEERRGVHQLAPYRELEARLPDDGAPEGDGETFAGFTGPIKLAGFHAYQVIDPQVGAADFYAYFDVGRLPVRTVRFVRPGGAPLRNVRVDGLAPWQSAFGRTVVAVDDGEAEVMGLDEATPRELIVVSDDGKWATKATVAYDDPQPRTIELAPTVTVSGLLCDAATGQPLVGYAVRPMRGVSYAQDPLSQQKPVVTDAAGRFTVEGLIPGVAASITFEDPETKNDWGNPIVHAPESLKHFIAGDESRQDLGEIQIDLPASPETETDDDNG